MDTHEHEEFTEPRPVYEGDWQSATGVEKGQHSERIRQWKARRDAFAQSRMGKGVDPRDAATQPLSPTPDAQRALLADPNYVALVAIRDNPGAHDSDRIRATDAILRMRAQAEGQQVSQSPLTDLRAILDTLAPHERLAWLQGERLEAMPTRQSA
jgi:hypothetical protein